MSFHFASSIYSTAYYEIGTELNHLLCYPNPRFLSDEEEFQLFAEDINFTEALSDYGDNADYAAGIALSLVQMYKKIHRNDLGLVSTYVMLEYRLIACIKGLNLFENL